VVFVAEVIGNFGFSLHRVDGVEVELDILDGDLSRVATILRAVDGRSGGCSIGVLKGVVPLVGVRGALLVELHCSS
jgi:hypothetical protein